MNGLFGGGTLSWLLGCGTLSWLVGGGLRFSSSHSVNFLLEHAFNSSVLYRIHLVLQDCNCALLILEVLEPVTFTSTTFNHSAVGIAGEVAHVHDVSGEVAEVGDVSDKVEHNYLYLF